MIQVDTKRNIVSYLGEGDITQEKIKNSILIHESVSIWGCSSDSSISKDSSFHELIRTALEGLNSVMEWRKRFTFNKKDDPIMTILGDRVNDFYRVFDDLRKEKISIILSGSRTDNPFLFFIDKMNFVVAIVDPDKQAFFYGCGLLETWRADPRILQFD